MDPTVQNGAVPEVPPIAAVPPPESTLQDIITALVTGAFTLISGITALRAFLRTRKK